MDEHKHDAIVISGGALKGILGVGVLTFNYLHNNYTNPIDEYAGTSAGSVICLLLACGFTPLEIFRDIYEFEEFLYKDYTMESLISNSGAVDIDDLMGYLKPLVINKMGSVPTFKELYDLTGNKLNIVAGDVTYMEEYVFSVDTTPEVSIVEAAKFSCNIPGIFQKKTFVDDKGVEHILVDGGCVNNLPYEYISDSKKNILAIVLSNSTTVDVDTNYEYFHRCILLFVRNSTEKKCNLAPKRVKIVKTVWDEKDEFQSSVSLDKKRRMFIKGFTDAKNASAPNSQS